MLDAVWLAQTPSVGAIADLQSTTLGTSDMPAAGPQTDTVDCAGNASLSVP
jgi:hypothetical protein